MSAATEERTLPHSIEAEEAVLGAVMLEPGAMAAVVPFLRPEHFYRTDHQKLCAAFANLFARGVPIDVLSVREELKRTGDNDLAGNADLFVTLGGAVPSIANAAYYAEVVRRKAGLRDLIRAGNEIIVAAYDEQPDALALAESRIRALTLDADQAERVDNVTALRELIEQAERGEADEAALSTGLGKVDVVTHGGLRRGELWIVGGRPGTGKSTLVVNLFRNGLRRGRRMALFSLEVTRRQFLGNLLACTAGADSQTWRDVDGWPTQWARVTKAADELGGECEDAFRNCLIDDSGHLTPAVLNAKAERFAAGGPVDFVFVDHVQLVQSDGPANGQTELSRLTDTTRALKLLAKRLDCVVIALSQLSRGSVKDCRPPRLDDLRASGSLEQDADGVLLLHDEPSDRATLGRSDRHDIIIAKQRHGPKRVLEMIFNRPCLRFEPYGPEDDEEVPFD